MKKSTIHRVNLSLHQDLWALKEQIGFVTETISESQPMDKAINMNKFKSCAEMSIFN